MRISFCFTMQHPPTTTIILGLILFLSMLTILIDARRRALRGMRFPPYPPSFHPLCFSSGWCLPFISDDGWMEPFRPDRWVLIWLLVVIQTLLHHTALIGDLTHFPLHYYFYYYYVYTLHLLCRVGFILPLIYYFCSLFLKRCYRYVLLHVRVWGALSLSKACAHKKSMYKIKMGEEGLASLLHSAINDLLTPEFWQFDDDCETTPPSTHPTFHPLQLAAAKIQIWQTNKQKVTTTGRQLHSFYAMVWTLTTRSLHRIYQPN